MSNSIVIPILKRLSTGAILAASGAFVWALIGLYSPETSLTRRILDTTALAAFSVLVSSWFVLPLGAVLGVLIPRLVKSCSMNHALFRGVLLGLGTALIAALFTTIIIEWNIFFGGTVFLEPAWVIFGNQYIRLLPTMTPVCILWVAGWTYIQKRNVA